MATSFPYFAQPERFAVWLDGDTTCDACQQTRRCFDAEVFYGEETMAAICPDCLAGGQLKNRDIFTCEGDIEELTRQIRALYHRLAKDKDGDWLFQRSLYHTVKGEADGDELWEDSMPAKEIKDQAVSQDYETLFYVFQSRTSGEIVTVWDAM